MKTLIVGSGGREDALLSCVLNSSRVSSVFVCPGNGGMQARAKLIPIPVDDIKGIIDFVLSNDIEYVIIGPEYPLTLGLSDELRDRGIKCFGVSKRASLLESSKSFAKNILNKYNIPTARHKEFTSIDKANAYIEDIAFPTVIKYDGLAAGKGVYICDDYDRCKEVLKQIFIDKKFGSSPTIVIEEYLEGKEISAFAFSDGKTVLPLIYAKDYKKVYEGDKGPNTGGMGSYTPSSFITDNLKKNIYDKILKPTIDALNLEGIEYKGILYAGLMISDDRSSIKVLEYNVRFGDPEAQVILPLLKTDFIDIVDAIEQERLSSISLSWNDSTAICVVLASEGYPLDYDTGYPIEGLVDALGSEGVSIFHAGTKLNDAKLYTSGGRVLNVVALGDTLDIAYKRVYAVVDKISFSNKYFRKDIALEDIKDRNN